VPRPESFPRDAWHAEVIKGYEFYAQSGRSDLDPPPLSATAAHFQSRAPEKLILPKPPDASAPLRVEFTIQELAWPRQQRLAPAIAHVRWAQMQPLPRPVLLACDMRDGSVLNSLARTWEH
jgi:hypothetical protein